MIDCFKLSVRIIEPIALFFVTLFFYFILKFTEKAQKVYNQIGFLTVVINSIF